MSLDGRVLAAVRRGMRTSAGSSFAAPTIISALDLDAGVSSEFTYAGGSITLTVNDVVKNKSGSAGEVELCTASDEGIGVVIRVNPVVGGVYSCVVQQFGRTPDIFTGLTPGAWYYTAAAGAIAASGTYKAGKAVSDKALILRLSTFEDVGGIVRYLGDLADCDPTGVAAGDALVYDGAAWGVGAPDAISDADGDTKVQVEEGADDDTWRVDTAGTQRASIGATGTITVAAMTTAGLLANTSGGVVTGGNTLATLTDADGDTKWQTEEAADEDIARLDIGGAQVVAIQNADDSSSGVAVLWALTPSVNQSGTAGYTAIEVDVTQTATGSGAKNLLDLQVGGTSQFLVSNAGAVTAKALTVTGNTTFGDAASDTVTFVGAMLPRILASDPLDATPANRPAGTLNEPAIYNNAWYQCTNASTPTWVAM